MDSTVLAAIIGGSGVVLVAFASLVVNAMLENRRGERQAKESAQQRDAADRARHEEYHHQRVERSYADRRDAISTFLTEVDRLSTWASQLEFEDYKDRHGPPSVMMDGPDLDRFTVELERTRSMLDLLCSPGCRTAAGDLAKTTSLVVTEWVWTGHHDARETFIEAARNDLALPQLTRVESTRTTNWRTNADDRTESLPPANAPDAP